jgi:hypothetical protein
LFAEGYCSISYANYGVAADATDEYVCIGESTALESLRRFVKVVIDVFGEEYLRAPNESDIHRLLALGDERGFPVMLGSLDCMHWRWKNCPSSLQGQFSGHHHTPTIILEAVASQDLWIWHAFLDYLALSMTSLFFIDLPCSQNYQMEKVHK